MVFSPSLALTTLVGGTQFNLSADKFLSAIDVNGTSVITITDNGTVQDIAITLTSAQLKTAFNALAANTIFSATTKGVGSTTLYLNCNRVVKFYENNTNTGTSMWYWNEYNEVNRFYDFTDTPATINTAAGTSFAVTYNSQGTTVYLNNFLVRNMEEVPNPNANGGVSSLQSAILAHYGTGVTPAATGTMSGGTANDAAKFTVNTTQVSDTATGGTDPVVTAAGTGADPTQTLVVAGGTGTPAQMTFSSKAVSMTATPVAAGSGYAPADTFNPNGGTGTKAVMTVTHTKVVGTPTVVAGGTGGTPGLTTFTGVSGTGTKFQLTGTINGSGILTGALTLTVAGDYTVNPTTLTGTAITGGGLTGATVAISMGALTVSLTTGGAYTVNPTAITASGTTAVTGTGTGMTVTFVMGVNAITGFTTRGSYTVNPTLTSNAVTGGATSATVTITMGVGTFTITDAGSYSVIPTNPISSTLSAGSGATFTGTFANTITLIQYDGKQNATYENLYVNESPQELATAINAL